MTSLEPTPLSDRDRAIIRAAAGTDLDAGKKLAALTYASGMSPAKTWQRPNEMLGQQEAWEAEPVAMTLLQRRRDRGNRTLGRPFTIRA